MKEIARVLIGAGFFLVLLGLLFAVGGKIPWLGRLPGDFMVKRGGFSVYFPLATCLLLSLIMTLVLNFFKKGNP